jgi:phosphoglycerate dehydrogenase-like enzyme
VVIEPGNATAGAAVTALRRIAILDDYQDVARGMADWASLNMEVAVFHQPFSDAGEVISALTGFEVVVAMRERTAFPARVLQSLPDLALLISTGPAVNAVIDLDAAHRHGITVCYTGYSSTPTVELTWALILGAARNLTVESDSMRSGGWQRSVGVGLAGKTLAILGLGRIGSLVARTGQSFGMTTIAWSPNLTEQRAAEHGVTSVSKQELFGDADVLTIHLGLGDRTRGIVNAAELRAMKPSALLVNTSRGPIVDEAALVAALRAGTVGGAALDVFDVEPLPAEHVLRSLPNVLLSPHQGFVTREQYQTFYRDAVENIAAFEEGRPIRVLR